MTSLGSFLRISVLLLPIAFVLSPATTHADITPNLTIEYAWNGTAVTQDSIFDFPLNEAHASQYTWPGGNAYGDIYRGTLGQGAALIDGHFLGNTGTRTESSDKFAVEGEYFVVIYNVPSSIPDVRNWFMNGTSTNPSAVPPANWGIVRFKVGRPGVDLYTQITSNYPLRLPEDDWANRVYANGRGELGDDPCGTFISSCGCALTSVVMVTRYHDITSAQGTDVNPLNLNDWLNNNDGYLPDGGVNWYRISAYTDWQLRVGAKKNVPGDFTLPDAFTAIDTYLEADNPVIVWSAEQDHFLVVDRKLTGTYAVKDPRWYNTETLDDSVVGGIDYVGQRRDYNNTIAGIRAYVPHNGTPLSYVTIALGSPAELLITDSQGRRLGKDANGVIYNEIPNSSYGADHIGNPDNLGPLPLHMNKTAYVESATSDTFSIQVIGTGDGPYTLQTTFADTTGNSRSTTTASLITTGQVIAYAASFDPSNAGNSLIEEIPADTTPPITTAILSGVVGTNGWYRSSVSVTFSATDDKSGVAKTEYSLDGGVNWNDYVAPFDVSGNGPHELSYRSIDNIGNIEETKSELINIDETPPEVALLLDPVTRTLTALPFDTLDEHPTVVKGTNQFTASDAAGNSTIITTKTVSRVGYLTGAKIVSIQYNGGSPITLPDNAVAYGWKLKSGQINTLGEGVWIRGALLSAGLYSKSKNQTVLTTYNPVTKKTNISNKPGLVLVGLQTNNGVLSVFTK